MGVPAADGVIFYYGRRYAGGAENGKHHSGKIVLSGTEGAGSFVDALRAEAVASGEILKLNEELYPDCYLHTAAENDVARVEDRTFICSRKEEDATPHSIVKWMDPQKAYQMAGGIARQDKGEL